MVPFHYWNIFACFVYCWTRNWSLIAANLVVIVVLEPLKLDGYAVAASYPGALNHYNTWSIQVGRRRCTLPISPFAISPHYNTSCKLVICASLFFYKETPGYEADAVVFYQHNQWTWMVCRWIISLMFMRMWRHVQTLYFHMVISSDCRAPAYPGYFLYD
jgi:hypothetical protein